MSGVTVAIQTEGGDVRNETLTGDAVVITAVGNACDRTPDGLMAEFVPQLQGMATSSGPQADGYDIRIARDMGANVVHMNHIQVHPTGMVNPSDASNLTKFLAPEAFRGSGGILVNQKGLRF